MSQLSTPTKDVVFAAPLYYEISGIWEKIWCVIKDRVFTGRLDNSNGNIIFQVCYSTLD
jgi:hypothetical protein